MVFPMKFGGFRIDQARATRALRDVVAEHGSTWQAEPFLHGIPMIIPIHSHENNGDGNI
jgi:hypothetical protein